SNLPLHSFSIVIDNSAVVYGKYNRGNSGLVFSTLTLLTNSQYKKTPDAYLLSVPLTIYKKQKQYNKISQI
ncbi:hypothetical protein BpHYR1_002807, partial [Brachionus plicatilis]